CSVITIAFGFWAVGIIRGRSADGILSRKSPTPAALAAIRNAGVDRGQSGRASALSREPFPFLSRSGFRDSVHVGPPALDCTGLNGVSADDVRRAQEEWAKYLGRDVEENVEIADGVTMTFVLVPPGTFFMGSPPDEKGKNGRYPNETLHVVTLTEPFDLGKYEVTQAQFAALSGKSPSYYKGPNCPVEHVTWDEA